MIIIYIHWDSKASKKPRESGNGQGSMYRSRAELKHKRGAQQYDMLSVNLIQLFDSIHYQNCRQTAHLLSIRRCKRFQWPRQVQQGHVQLSVL